MWRGLYFLAENYCIDEFPYDLSQKAGNQINAYEEYQS